MGPDNTEALIVNVLPATYPVAAIPGSPREENGNRSLEPAYKPMISPVIILRVVGRRWART